MFLWSYHRKRHCERKRNDHGCRCGTEFTLVSLYSIEITRDFWNRNSLGRTPFHTGAHGGFSLSVVGFLAGCVVLPRFAQETAVHLQLQYWRVPRPDAFTCREPEPQHQTGPAQYTEDVHQSGRYRTLSGASQPHLQLWAFQEVRLDTFYPAALKGSGVLSHTWVRYPGFSGHGIKCPILTTVVPGFPAIWLAVPFGANGAHLGICTLPEKKIFLCEISCFCVKLSFLKGELVLWSLYGDKLSLCRNQQMNGKI